MEKQYSDLLSAVTKDNKAGQKHTEELELELLKADDCILDLQVKNEDLVDLVK